MNKTKIEWCDYTLNPVVGCKNNCWYCYARKLNTRFSFVHDFSKPEFFPERAFHLKSLKKGSRVFVNSMSDFNYWKQDWIDFVIELVLQYHHIKFFFLTKFPKAFFKIPCWPKNAILGITLCGIETHNHISDAICTLKSFTPRNLVFLSLEPLLGAFKYYYHTPWIDLVIIGALTGTGKKITNEHMIDRAKHAFCKSKSILYKENITRLKYDRL